MEQFSTKRRLVRFRYSQVHQWLWPRRVEQALHRASSLNRVAINVIVIQRRREQSRSFRLVAGLSRGHRPWRLRWLRCRRALRWSKWSRCRLHLSRLANRRVGEVLPGDPCGGSGQSGADLRIFCGWRARSRRQRLSGFGGRRVWIGSSNVLQVIVGLLSDLKFDWTKMTLIF